MRWKMVYHECSNFAKQVDTEALKEKANNAERKARKQIFLEASLAASKETITYSNNEGSSFRNKMKLMTRDFRKRWIRRMRKSTKESKKN